MEYSREFLLGFATCTLRAEPPVDFMIEEEKRMHALLESRKTYIYIYIYIYIILRLLTKHILQLQNLKLKESIYRYYRLDQNYIKTRKNSTAVVIIRTITIDLLINRLFR